MSKDLTFSRREMIAASAMGVAALATDVAFARTGLQQENTEKAPQQPTSSSFPPRVEKVDITVDDIKRAEKMMGLSYSDAERQQLLDAVGGQVEAMQISRQTIRPNGLAPATQFDPRLPGRIYQQADGDVITTTDIPDNAPDDLNDLAFAPLTHLAKWMENGKITSVQLTKLYLNRIKVYNPILHCFITVTSDLALTEARKADQEIAAGNYKGPLHGIPYALKDLIDTRDIRTTWGAAPYKNRLAQEDAAIVSDLRKAGAVLLGKASCGALAYGDLWFDHRTRNPWNVEEGSSGSSAGSASATAAGLCGFSIGTETLGSIISPANRCGLAGLRPTYGRVSRHGAMALSWSLDKIGPITRTVEDCALVLDAINGFDARDTGSVSAGFSYHSDTNLSDLRIGYFPAAFEGDGVNEVDKNALETLRAMNVDLVPLTMADDLPTDMLFRIVRAEAAAAFEELTLSNRDDELIGQDDRDRPNAFRLVRFLSAVDYINMDRFRRSMMEMMDGFFENVDAIVGPNYALGMLGITNFTGHPQIAFKAGFSEEHNRTLPNDERAKSAKKRVPHCFSVWSNLYDEGTAIRIAKALEDALGQANTRPEGFNL